MNNQEIQILSTKGKIVVILFVAVVVAGSTLALWSQYNRRMDFRNLLEEYGIKVVEGVIESPSVLITTEDLTEFVDMAKNSGTVYQNGNVFYVLNDKETIAWKYDTTNNPIN